MPNEETKANNSTKIKRQIGDALQGNDEPLGRKYPSAPFAIVWYAYPIALLALLLVAILLLQIFR
jgi:hypothetical protein